MVLFALLGCSGALVQIQITERADTVVPGASLLEELAGDLGFDALTTMDLTANEELANQGVEPGDIQDVQLIDFRLTVLEPDTQDLSFLDEMAVYVEAPGLPREQVAAQASFPEGQGEVRFVLTGLDLTPYAVSERMTLGTEVTGRRPDEDTTVRATVTLDVGVTAQGVRGQL